MEIEPDLKGASVLITDDDPSSLSVAESMLKEFGFETHLAMDGDAAIESALIQPPDLILLDITMPKRNGYSVCEEIKANGKLSDIPIIFTSSLSEGFNKKKGFALGAVDYITKPMQIEDLWSRVVLHIH